MHEPPRPLGIVNGTNLAKNAPRFKRKIKGWKYNSVVSPKTMTNTLQDSNEKSKDENTTQLFLQRLWQTRNHQIFYFGWRSDLKFEISAVVPTWKVDVRWYNMVLDLLVRCLKKILKHILPNPNGDKHVGLPWSEVKIITKKTNLLGGWTTHLQNISGGENKKYLKPSKAEWDRIPMDPEM